MVKLIVSVVLPRDWVATSCHTVRRPLHVNTLCRVRMVTPSRLELLTPHWECGDLDQLVEGALWCAGLDSNQRTVTERFYRPRTLTTCIPAHIRRHKPRGAPGWFQSNAPHAGCNSKTIQFKRILVARRIYSFANYVLHILKHLPTYCIGIAF